MVCLNSCPTQGSDLLIALRFFLEEPSSPYPRAIAKGHTSFKGLAVLPGLGPLKSLTNTSPGFLVGDNRGFGNGPVGAESDQHINICSFAVRCDRMWPSTQ